MLYVRIVLSNLIVQSRLHKHAPRYDKTKHVYPSWNIKTTICFHHTLDLMLKFRHCFECTLEMFDRTSRVEVFLSKKMPRGERVLTVQTVVIHTHTVSHIENLMIVPTRYEHDLTSMLSTFDPSCSMCVRICGRAWLRYVWNHISPMSIKEKFGLVQIKQNPSFLSWVCVCV